MELLIVNEENWETSISPEALEFEAFKKLIKKHPKLAKQLLAYVRLIEHPLSPFMEYPEKQRSARIAQTLGMEINPLDYAILEARKGYRETLRSSNSDTVSAIRDGLFSAVNLIERSSSLVETLIDEVDGKNLKNAKNKADAIKNLKEANDLLDNILDKAAKVPKAIETLDDLSEKLRKKMSQKRKVRGKGDINLFEE